MIGPLRRRLLDLANAFVEAADDADERARRRTRLEPLLEALGHGIFRIAVMGEVKKGKSSFVNALLGEEDLLPTDVDVATSTVYKIVHGSAERLTVFFEADDEGIAPAPLEIGRDRLAEFGSETGNPGNAKRVEFIAIELPHPLLADGVAIVDTPGVGGLFRKHREITFRYAPHADAVFFVLDSVAAVISRDEIEFLKELRRHAPQILFLQTKTDLASEEQVEAWRRRNLKILSETLRTREDDIPYFLVASKLKRRADRTGDVERLKASGFPDVAGYVVNRLIPRRDEILVRRWLPALSPELAAAAKRLLDSLAILKEAHLPQMREYESRLTEAEADFDRWQSEVWPERIRAFESDANRLKRNVRNRLQDRLSSEDPDCLAAIAELRSSCQTADDVAERGDDLLQSWAARWSSDSVDILKEFRRDYVKRLEELLGDVAGDLDQVAFPELRVEAAGARIETADRFAVFREAAMNSSVFGGLAGEAAKWTGIGAGYALLFGMVTGPVAAAIAATAGAAYYATRAWSAHRGYRAASERQKEAAIAAVERTLAKTGGSALRSALRAYEDLAAELDAAVRGGIDAFRAQVKREFSGRRREILEARARTADEAKAAEERAKGALARCQELIAEFRNLERSLEPEEAPA